MIYNFCLSVAARIIVLADPSVRYTSMLLGRSKRKTSTFGVEGPVSTLDQIKAVDLRYWYFQLLPYKTFGAGRSVLGLVGPAKRLVLGGQC